MQQGAQTHHGDGDIRAGLLEKAMLELGPKRQVALRHVKGALMEQQKIQNCKFLCPSIYLSSIYLPTCLPTMCILPSLCFRFCLFDFAFQRNTSNLCVDFGLYLTTNHTLLCSTFYLFVCLFLLYYIITCNKVGAHWNSIFIQKRKVHICLENFVFRLANPSLRWQIWLQNFGKCCISLKYLKEVYIWLTHKYTRSVCLIVIHRPCLESLQRVLSKCNQPKAQHPAYDRN